MAESSLPKQFPHIFRGVLFEVIPEIDYGELCYLSEIARAKNEVPRYRHLEEALRKIQWAKLACLEAIGIEERIEAEMNRGGSVQGMSGQVQHAKAMFDFVAHAKAALDSVAVFLNDYLRVGDRGGARDFRRPEFCDKITKQDSEIGKHITSLRPWLDRRRQSLDSLIAVRDEWIHRLSLSTFLVLPRSEVGFLPVPRLGAAEDELARLPLSNPDCWSTREFVEFHWSRLTRFFNLVVKRCTELEAGTLPESPSRPSVAGKPISAVPLRVTEPITIQITI